MSYQSYVVSSPGRTGSTMVKTLLKAASLQVFHTNDPFFTLKEPWLPNESLMILVKRRDLFSAIMSSCVGKRTNEYTKYTNKQIMPFTVPCHDCDSEFVHQYNWHKWYFESCRGIDAYKDIKTVFFEDFVNAPSHVFEAIGYPMPAVYSKTQVSPYRAQDIVINYAECKDMFDSLEKTAVLQIIPGPYDPTKKNWQ